jgi:hypothetical protein
MIAYIIISIVVTILIFSTLFKLTRSVVVGLFVSTSVLLTMILLGYWFIKDMDEPPANSRIITQEELNKAAGLE